MNELQIHTRLVLMMFQSDNIEVMAILDRAANRVEKVIQKLIADGIYPDPTKLLPEGSWRDEPPITDIEAIKHLGTCDGYRTNSAGEFLEGCRVCLSLMPFFASCDHCRTWHRKDGLAKVQNDAGFYIWLCIKCWAQPKGSWRDEPPML